MCKECRRNWPLQKNIKERLYTTAASRVESRKQEVRRWVVQSRTYQNAWEKRRLMGYSENSESFPKSKGENSLSEITEETGR